MDRLAAGRRGRQSDRGILPGVNPNALTAAAERYRKLDIWKSTPKIDAKAMDKFQDILVQGNVLENSKRVKFEKLVLTEFANKAK